MSDFPCIGFFPALPLEKNLELGEWVVGSAFVDIPWRSEKFKRLAEAVIASCSRSDFKTAPTGVRLWHRDRGFDGTKPAPAVLDRINAAVTFAVLNANDHILDRRNGGHYLATTENAALYLQAIDEASEFITHHRGGALNHALVIGPKIGGEPISLPDAVMPILRPPSVSTKLASEIFTALEPSGSKAARSIRLAIEWHGAAMANPYAVTLQQRLIGLKTGFEILFGTDDSRACARALRQLFETVTNGQRHGLPWVGLLWSPDERTDLCRPYRQRKRIKIDVRSELEDWFMTLATARNKIIHEGQLSVTEYGRPPERPLSRYSGPLFWTGERLLREAIKAHLGPEVLLCGSFAMSDAFRAAFAEISSAGNDDNEEHPAGDAVEVPSEAEPPALSSNPQRDLRSLLQVLRGRPANEVLLERDGRGAKIQDLGTMELLMTISITAAEHALLKAAGAEEELSDVWIPCD